MALREGNDILYCQNGCIKCFHYNCELPGKNGHHQGRQGYECNLSPTPTILIDIKINIAHKEYAANSPPYASAASPCLLYRAYHTVLGVYRQLLHGTNSHLRRSLANKP